MKIKCRKCRKIFIETNEKEDIFCPYCGALIDSTDQIVDELISVEWPTLVWFENTLEEGDVPPRFGILFPDRDILCLETGEMLEPFDEYKILKLYPEIGIVDQTLKKHVWYPFRKGGSYHAQNRTSPLRTGNG